MDLNLLKEYKDTTLAAINSYLDRMYDFKDTYVDKNGEIYQQFSTNKKVKDFINSIIEETKTYEDLRKKILDDGIDSITLFEYNLIKLAYGFILESWKQQIKNLEKATLETEKILNKLKA